MERDKMKLSIYARLRVKQAQLYSKDDPTPRDARRTRRALDEVESLFSLHVHAALDIADMLAGEPIHPQSPFSGVLKIKYASITAREFIVITPGEEPAWQTSR